MKQSLFLFLVVLLTATVSFGEPSTQELLETSVRAIIEINKTRVGDMEVLAVLRSPVLIMMAEEYAKRMARMGVASHQAMDTVERLQLRAYWENWYGEKLPYGCRTIELVVAIQYNGRKVWPTEVARAFDKSKIHSQFLYHPAARTIGLWAQPAGDMIYICVYITVPRSAVEQYGY